VTTLTAVHEAGHAVASYVLGFTHAGAVTVRGHGTVGGLCVAGDAPDVASRIVADFAGHAAVEVLDVWADADDAVVEGAPELEALPADEARDVAVFLLAGVTQSQGVDGGFMRDDQHAWRLGCETWPRDAMARVPALERRARELVATYAHAVHALAAQLATHGALARDQWHAVLADVGLTHGEARTTAAP